MTTSDRKEEISGVRWLNAKLMKNGRKEKKRNQKCSSIRCLLFLRTPKNKCDPVKKIQ
jgi:hypothetical protein